MPVTKSSAKTNWFAFSAITPVFITRKIEDAVNSEMPGLRVTDEDRYYSLLLERAGQSS